MYLQLPCKLVSYPGSTAFGSTGSRSVLSQSYFIESASASPSVLWASLARWPLRQDSTWCKAWLGRPSLREGLGRRSKRLQKCRNDDVRIKDDSNHAPRW